jgi:hypothetical protein
MLILGFTEQMLLSINQDPTMSSFAGAFARGSAIGVLPAFYWSALSNYTRALHRPGFAMWSSIFGVVVNVLCCWLLILRWDLEAEDYSDGTVTEIHGHYHKLKPSYEELSNAAFNAGLSLTLTNIARWIYLEYVIYKNAPEFKAHQLLTDLLAAVRGGSDNDNPSRSSTSGRSSSRLSSSSNISSGRSSSSALRQTLSQTLEREPMWAYIKLSLQSLTMCWTESVAYEFQALVAGWLGAVALSVQVAGATLVAFVYMLALGLSCATSAMVGLVLGGYEEDHDEYEGMNDPGWQTRKYNLRADKARNVIRTSSWICIGVHVVVAVFLVVVRGPFSDVLAVSEEDVQVRKY